MSETRHIHSRYLNGGGPTNCANPNCREPFINYAWRADDGKYYCTEACAEFALQCTPVTEH